MKTPVDDKIVMQKPDDVKRMVVILDPADYDDWLQSPMGEAKEYFRQWHGPLDALNIMRLHSSASAILSAVIFNALIIVALIPLALRGVAYRAMGAAAVLRRNVIVYGIGGVIVPFIGIKLIDVLLVAVHLA